MSRTEIGLEEPKASERVYYRHRDTGELAYLVRFGDKAKLRLNRPGELILRQLNDQWFKDEDFGAKLEPMQRAKVALEADKALCEVLGLIPLARRDWTRMNDRQRISWCHNGPEALGDPTPDAVRRQLWQKVMSVMERLK